MRQLRLSDLRHFVAAVLIFVLGLSTASADTVLVEGQPPLTQEKVNRLGDYYEWVLEVRMSGPQRQQLQQSLVDAWKRNDTGEIAAAQDALSTWDGAGRMSEALRGMVREDFFLLHDAWRRWSAAWQVDVRHTGILVIPQWPAAHIAQEVSAFLDHGMPLSNELCQWKPSKGWVRRP